VVARLAKCRLKTEDELWPARWRNSKCSKSHLSAIIYIKKHSSCSCFYISRRSQTFEVVLRYKIGTDSSFRIRSRSIVSLSFKSIFSIFVHYFYYPVNNDSIPRLSRVVIDHDTLSRAFKSVYFSPLVAVLKQGWSVRRCDEAWGRIEKMSKAV
jgi:hypothetical protein